MKDFQYIPLKDSGKCLILDTDIGPDCDDAGAIAVMSILAKRYNVPVAGIITCTSSAYAAPCAEAIADFCDLQVGVIAENKQQGFLDTPQYERYNRFIAERFGTQKSHPEAVATYRRLLASCPDAGAVIAAIGPFSTLAQLVQSEPDEYSPLDGAALLQKKVYAVVTMAGKYPHGEEWNIKIDPASACIFFKNCRVPLIFSDFDLGYTVRSGFPYSAPFYTQNPVFMSYYCYFNSGSVSRELINASYDLTAIHFAIEGESAFYGLSEPEHFSVNADGENVFSTNQAPNCRRMVKRMSDEALGKYYTELLLSTANSTFGAHLAAEG